MFNKPVIRPCFGGGYIRGGRLTSHDMWRKIWNNIPLEGNLLDERNSGSNLGGNYWALEIEQWNPQNGDPPSRTNYFQSDLVDSHVA